MIWFTADTHFYHEHILKYVVRPFPDVGAMNEGIVEAWNAVVKKGDTVYHLGDFALTWGKDSAAAVDTLLARLNGQKWLITGNHDRREVRDNPRWIKVLPYHEISVRNDDGSPLHITLCHYPLRVWNHMRYGAWMLHGHSHGTLSDIGGKTADVGVDARGMQPISLDSLMEFMRTRTLTAYDHHDYQAVRPSTAGNPEDGDVSF